VFVAPRPAISLAFATWSSTTRTSHHPFVGRARNTYKRSAQTFSVRLDLVDVPNRADVDVWFRTHRIFLFRHSLSDPDP